LKIYLQALPEHNSFTDVVCLKIFIILKLLIKSFCLFWVQGKLPLRKNINIYIKDIKSSRLEGAINNLYDKDLITFET
jgi:hypothetical protein